MVGLHDEIKNETEVDERRSNTVQSFCSCVFEYDKVHVEKTEDAHH